MTDDSEDQQGPAEEYASATEATAAIRAWTDDEYIKLMLVAGFHWKQRRLSDSLHPEELLAEAVLRTLDGRRRWRKEKVSLLYHLDRTMESISGHAVRDAVTEREAVDELTAEELDRRTVQPRRFNRPVAEEQLLARAELQDIESLFTNTPDALKVLRLKAEGHTESEIIRISGMDKRRYEAARKKTEREIAKYVVQKEKNNGKGT